MAYDSDETPLIRVQSCVWFRVVLDELVLLLSVVDPLNTWVCLWLSSDSSSLISLIPRRVFNTVPVSFTRLLLHNGHLLCFTVALNDGYIHISIMVVYKSINIIMF